MGTSFDSVIDMALVVIRDYKLDDLYCSDEDGFKEVMDGYILKAVPRFEVSCLKSLKYDVDMRQFEEELDTMEIDILSGWTVVAWYEDQLQDVLEFKESLRNVDFNRFATGQNLKPRQMYLEKLRKDLKQDATNYQFYHMAQIPYFGSKL